MEKPWIAERNEWNEPNSPDRWRVYAADDDSYEATICELWSGEHNNAALARLIAAAPELLAVLKAAEGYLLNAKIDLETGAPKRTAIMTIDGGLKVVRAAIVKAQSGLVTTTEPAQ